MRIVIIKSQIHETLFVIIFLARNAVKIYLLNLVLPINKTNPVRGLFCYFDYIISLLSSSISFVFPLISSRRSLA